ncbi:predicted protein [Sclerotinia sclerotiorum 1980 UF-70]|uniref:Uncharacterized protein n=1 Tax=Sclerotinia sclerotiorum (strain ATCC 18683 / 1980 / Ss-1) TaxID=665079 RepID=A7EQI1_SCLS1|nr:predicted protein [Sclerotinia sclerotiorum 1980 UF-70]EDN91723.1 predicted protein [Sclerotinia sclerotiorum 1980 UF-70]
MYWCTRVTNACKTKRFGESEALFTVYPKCDAMLWVDEFVEVKLCLMLFVVDSGFCYRVICRYIIILLKMSISPCKLAG